MMSAEIWDKAIIGIFFFYGLAFYLLGLGLLVSFGRASELGLARSMRLLAGFGLLHGCHEWLDMFERELALHYHASFPCGYSYTRLALLVASFLALTAFGEHLLARRAANEFTWRITIVAALFYVFSAVAVQLVYRLDDREWARGADVLARYILGMPGAVVACIALLQQRAIFRKTRHRAFHARSDRRRRCPDSRMGWLGRFSPPKATFSPRISSTPTCSGM